VHSYFTAQPTATEVVRAGREARADVHLRAEQARAPAAAHFAAPDSTLPVDNVQLPAYSSPSR
jgi:hypothetical protein